MFSPKSKLESNLRRALELKLYKSYRVNIYCRTLQENIEKKVKTYKGTLIRSIHSLNIICASLSPHAIERLIEFPEVRHISMDTYALLCGTSILASNGIRFQEKSKLTGRGIGIGIVDSGVYPHPDLLNPYNKVRGFVDLINGYKFPYDDNGHGTFMCGILSGSGYLSKGMYRGVAENSSLYCIKAFNGLGKGYISDILYAVEYMISENTDWEINIICLPFELTSYDYYSVSAFSKLFDTAIQKGIIPVVPSGNNGNTECSITGIAALPNCITVGGLDTTSTPSAYRYSSAGPCGKLEKPDLSAACVDICSLSTNMKYISERNGMKIFPQALEKPYTNFTGTSCSAAFISGLCALLLENNPQLSFKDIVSLLKISCMPLDIPKVIQGSGMLDTRKLLP